MSLNFMKISPAEIKPGDRYFGYELALNEQGKTPIKLCPVVINADGKPENRYKAIIAEDIVFYYKNLPVEHKIKSSEQKEIKCDLENSRNQLNLMGLHTDLYDIGDSTHDGYNAWLVSDWKKQLSNIEKQNFFIVGIAEKSPWECGYIDEAMALVIEYDSTGDRVWYHVDPNKIAKMRAESLEAYNALMAK